MLDQLVLRQIQLQRASRFGIAVSDEMFNQALSNVAQSNRPHARRSCPTRSPSRAPSYPMYREDSREQLILEQLEQREVVSRITVAPRELDLCLSQLAANASNELDYNVSHILVGLSSSASAADIEAARKRVNEVYDKLEAGEDFAQLAVTYSDSQDALEGGSLGWRKGSQLPTLFSDVVARMKPGEYSEPMQSASGFHIVRLNDERGAEPQMVSQMHARHILMTPTEVLNDEAVQQKLVGIRQEISMATISAPSHAPSPKTSSRRPTAETSDGSSPDNSCPSSSASLPSSTPARSVSRSEPATAGTSPRCWSDATTTTPKT